MRTNKNVETKYPEHSTIFALNSDIEKQKEERRKLQKKMRNKGGVPKPIILTNDGKIKESSKLTLIEQDEEFIKCATNPIYFIETYLTIFDQTAGDGGAIVPFILFEFQKRLINDYEKHRFNVANKYRQAGISTTTCAYIAWYVMFNRNRSVAIIADKLETARDELMFDVVGFIDSCPEFLKPQTDKKDTQKLKRYDNGSSLSAFSSKGLRGYTPTLLFWDETAWTEKNDKFWIAAKPTLQTGGRAIFISTPNGLDPTFYKTFDYARRGENQFNAVELWWFNDPRYNKDLEWVINKNKENEIRKKDTSTTDKERIKLMDEGWSATSPWFEAEVRNANGDMRKIAQEILCVGGDTEITVQHKTFGNIQIIKIEDFYKILKRDVINKIIENSIISNNYKILVNENKFVNFHGVKKEIKNRYLKITLENGKNISCSHDHIFIVSNKNITANSLIPKICYLSTIDGDFYIDKIEEINEKIELYDIIESSEDYQYLTNGIISHNCSFLGSGDNFIAEEYLKRIDDDEIRTPKRQEYLDKNMWIWEDSIFDMNYVITIDASAGHGDDYSTVNILKMIEIFEKKTITKNGIEKEITIKRHKVEQVAEYYGKVTPNVLAEIAYQYGIRYNNAYCVVDITGGYGVQTVEKLIELGYENIHYAEVSHKPSRDRLCGYIKRGDKIMPDGTISKIDLIPGFFIGGNRGSILIEVQRAIHLSDVIIRSVRLLNEFRTFITVPGSRVADHKRSFHDDSIMGLSLGLYVIGFDMNKFQNDKRKTLKTLDAMLSINTNNKNDDNNHKKMEKKRINETTRNPEFRTYNRNNPYGQHSWLFNNVN